MLANGRINGYFIEMRGRFRIGRITTACTPCTKHVMALSLIPAHLPEYDGGLTILQHVGDAENFDGSRFRSMRRFQWLPTPRCVFNFHLQGNRISRKLNESNRVWTTDAFWRTAHVFESSLNRLLNGIVSCS